MGTDLHRDQEGPDLRPKTNLGGSRWQNGDFHSFYRENISFCFLLYTLRRNPCKLFGIFSSQIISMLEAFEFYIGPFTYHVVLLSVVGESSLFLSMPWIYISHRFDFHCYLAGWRSEDVPQKVFVFFHSTILNYNAYTAIWCKSHTFWVRRLYDFVLLLASKYIFSWSVYILFIFETFTFHLSYEFNVLDNAFLVHAPGFKTVQERERQMKPAKVTIKPIIV